MKTSYPSRNKNVESQTAGSNDIGPHQMFKDYLMILRERFWWVIATIFIIFTTTVIYTVRSKVLYKSSVTVQVLRQHDTPAGFKNPISDTRIKNQEDLLTQVNIIKSGRIIGAVYNRLNEEERVAFMKSYEKGCMIFWKKNPTELLKINRKVNSIYQSLMVVISYTHPDRYIAAKIANLFAEEYIADNIRVRTESAHRAIEVLKMQIDKETRKIAEYQIQIADFQRQNNTVSVNPDTNIDQQALLKLNEAFTQDERILDEYETQWNLVKQFREDQKNLWDLTFIANAPQVTDLLSQVANYKVSIASLSKRYREKHPRMIEMSQSLKQAQFELQQVVYSAAEKIRTSWIRARENYNNSLKRINDKKKEIIELQTLNVEYSKVADNLERSRTMREYFKQRILQLITENNDPRESARVIYPAYPSVRPDKPNVFFNLVVGLFGGLASGVALAFLIAYIDDRIKTAFEVESVLGIPMVGVILQIKGSDSKEKAQLMAYDSVPKAVEGFRTIHSMLKLSEYSKQAKCFLSTSTIVNEGKSFVSSNLALTYANNGGKTIILDCDLRMPTVIKLLNINNKSGLTHYIKEDISLDQIITKEAYPNLDIIHNGERSHNPIRLFNSPKFEMLIEQLRERYDKIIIDTPPLAPVSDSLNILPFVDAVLFVIKFNAVKRHIIKSHIKNLRERNIPIFAILNNINISTAYHYYSYYYDKSYEGYYLDSDELKKAKKEEQVS